MRHDDSGCAHWMLFVDVTRCIVARPSFVMIDRLASQHGGTLTPEQLVEQCLDLVGPLTVDGETHAALVEFAAREGDLDLTERQPGSTSEQRVGNMLRMIASTREFQRA